MASTPRNRLRSLAIGMVACATIAAIGVMVGVGGILALSFQRKPQVDLVPFLVVLGVGCVAAIVCVALFRSHRRLVEASTFGEMAGPTAGPSAGIDPPVPLH